MTTAQETRPSPVLRWYTTARRIPKLIGKAPGGGTWPGGPYTVVQFVGGAAVFGVLSLTERWWGSGTWIQDKGVAAGAGLAVLFLLRFVKSGPRNPVEATVGVVAAASAPRWGTHAGRAVIAGQQVRRSRGRVNVYTAPRVATASAMAAASAAQSAPDTTAPTGPAEVTPAAPPPPAEAAAALSGVQRMLAQINDKEPVR